ncbi:MAG: hypothetical protein KF874_11935 [Rhizobiaceae bacterium]|nr:hypothetical protein [Rhizobiaceae bacterium]
MSKSLRDLILEHNRASNFGPAPAEPDTQSADIAKAVSDAVAEVKARQEAAAPEKLFQIEGAPSGTTFIESAPSGTTFTSKIGALTQSITTSLNPSVAEVQAAVEANTLTGDEKAELVDMVHYAAVQADAQLATARASQSELASQAITHTGAFAPDPDKMTLQQNAEKIASADEYVETVKTDAASVEAAVRANTQSASQETELQSAAQTAVEQPQSQNVEFAEPQPQPLTQPEVQAAPQEVPASVQEDPNLKPAAKIGTEVEARVEAEAQRVEQARPVAEAVTQAQAKQGEIVSTFNQATEFGSGPVVPANANILEMIEKSIQERSTKSKSIAQQISEHLNASKSKVHWENALNLSNGPSYSGSPLPQNGAPLDFSGTASKGKPDLASVTGQYKYLDSANSSSTNDGALNIDI